MTARKNPAPLALEVNAQAFASALAQTVRACSTRSVEILRGVRLEASGPSEFECDHCGETMDTEAECDAHAGDNPGHTFHVSGGSLSLAASDMELSIRSSVTATVAAPGAVVLAEAKRAASVLKGLSGPLTLSYDTDDRVGALVVVSWTGASYRFPALGVEDFPRLPALEGDAGTVETAALLAVLARVLPVASDDESRPVLCGVRLTLNDPAAMLRAVATDSYRLAVDEAAAVCVGGSLEMTVPARALAEMVRLAKRKGAPEEIAWSASSDHPEPLSIGFTVGATEVVARRVDGQYPNWRQLRPDRFEVEHELVAAELVAAAKRLSAFGKAAGSTYPTLALQVGPDGAVSLTARTGGYGDATETLPTPATTTDGGVPLADPCGFNGAFLADAAAFGGETVRMRLLSPLRPALFLGDREEAFHLLMPVRLA